MALARTSLGLCLMLAVVLPRPAARGWSTRDPADRDDYPSASSGRYDDDARSSHYDRDARDSREIRDSRDAPDDSAPPRHASRSSRYAEDDRGAPPDDDRRPSRYSRGSRAPAGSDPESAPSRSGRLASRWAGDEAADVSGDDENRRHDREMRKLESKLDDAERGENQRKVRAIEWEISRENKRHETALSRMEASRGRPGSVHRGSTYASHEGRGASDRADTERSAAYRDGDVQNPLRERSRRQSDQEAYGPRESDDGGDRDPSYGHHARGPMSDHVADAEAPIRRRW